MQPAYYYSLIKLKKIDKVRTNDKMRMWSPQYSCHFGKQLTFFLINDNKKNVHSLSLLHSFSL